MILGICGYASGGKDTLADYLVEKYNFVHLDFYRDILIGQLKERGLEINKINASKLGNELREKGGRGALAKIMAEKVDLSKDYVVTGIRSPEEAEELRKKAGFTLIYIQTSLDKRFERRKPEDPQTFEEFKSRDELDKQKGIDKVVESADILISNDGSIDELHSMINDLLEKLR